MCKHKYIEVIIIIEEKKNCTRQNAELLVETIVIAIKLTVTALSNVLIEPLIFLLKNYLNNIHISLSIT